MSERFRYKRQKIKNLFKYLHVKENIKMQDLRI